MNTQRPGVEGGRAVSPSPVITPHHSHLPHLHADGILGSIASGAHYSGALQSHSNEPPPLHPQGWRRRSMSRSAEDPQVELAFKHVIQDLEQLYSGKPDVQAMRRRWRDDAVLEHPLFRCTNLNEISAVLFAIPRLLRDAEHISSRILSAGLSPNRLVFAHTCVYTLRVYGTRKEIKSVVYVDLDEDMKIVQLIDQWNGEESSTRWCAGSFRRLFAKILSWTTSVPRVAG
ncbi:hypothetical protein BV20DRAFT_941288 [Pilatotrama ljubarskyi]|nr:hypothetical protein BV20DRAFT_941288 [Pilatotrama ljubarskyi]